jgi:hypothetical protein
MPTHKRPRLVADILNPPPDALLLLPGEFVPGVVVASLVWLLNVASLGQDRWPQALGEDVRAVCTHLARLLGRQRRAAIRAEATQSNGTLRQLPQVFLRPSWGGNSEVRVSRRSHCDDEDRVRWPGGGRGYRDSIRRGGRLNLRIFAFPRPPL